MDDLTVLAQKLSIGGEENAEFDIAVISESFRWLRNSCATDRNLQCAIGVHQTVLCHSISILTKLSLRLEDEAALLCFRVGIQFLGNLMVNNKFNQDLLWGRHSEELKQFLSVEDEKVKNYISMVYHNILLGRPKRGLIIASEKDLISRFVDNASSGIEFSLYLVETLINQGHFRNIYSSLVPIQRLFVLEILNVNIKNNKSIINVEDIKFLSEQFKRQSDCILKTVADYVETLEPQEVAAILPILGSASCKKEFSVEMQKDKSLFINCLFLLRSIHAVGKQRDSPFSMVDKAAEDSEDLQKHPGFGFKAQLVRVVGNLCCDNRDFQDLIRELDCIPLILDCCNIDARNPFITQWAILAIRNLCEKNTENQSVIASTDRKGVIPSTVLDQLNLKA